jgi:hypothetical protein
MREKRPVTNFVSMFPKRKPYVIANERHLPTESGLWSNLVVFGAAPGVHKFSSVAYLARDRVSVIVGLRQRNPTPFREANSRKLQLPPK